MIHRTIDKNGIRIAADLYTALMIVGENAQIPFDKLESFFKDAFEK